jgi:hypothetical protein
VVSTSLVAVVGTGLSTLLQYTVLLRTSGGQAWTSYCRCLSRIDGGLLYARHSKFQGLLLTHDLLTAPVFEAVEYEMVKVEGVLDNVSPYMGSGPEVDAAWDRLTWNTTCMCII